jgi:hypothetical protein
MSYDTTKLRLVDQDIEGGKPSLWYYTTVSDSDGTITGAGYFADGVTKGMEVGDLVDAVATTGPKYKRYQVASVSGAAATVAAPTAIT